MSAIVDSVRNFLSGKRPTDKDNVESELEPGDYDLGTAPPQSDEDKDLAGLIDSRHEASYQQRRTHDPEYMESLAFYRGQQWHEWRAGAGRLYDLRRDNKDPDRIYATQNKIKPIAKSLIARAIQSDVTVAVKPATPLPRDIAGANQMRGVVSHVQYVNKWSQLLHRCYRQAIVVGPCYVKIFWDKRAIVPLPKYDDAGNLVDDFDAEMGEVRLEFVSTFDLYPDPKARYWDEAEWVVHAKRVSLEYIKARWPEQGQYVQGDSAGGDSSQTIVENQIDNLVGDGNYRGTGTSQHAAILKEMWEKPSVRFPEGRFMVSAGGRLLFPVGDDKPDWPYEKMADFPFQPLVYDEGIETIWGDNAVYPLTGPQRHYNRLVSKQQEHARKGDGKLAVARGAGLDPGAFKTAKRDEIIYWNHLDEEHNLIPKPEFLPTPPLDATIIEGIRLMDDDMKAISSVNDVSQGMAESANMSGRAIANLQEADSSVNNIFTANMKTFAEGVFTKVGQIAQQMYLEPRLMYVQDSAKVSSITTAMQQMQGHGMPGGPPPMQPGQQPGMPPQGPPGQPQQQQQGPQAGSPQAGSPQDVTPAMQAMTFKEFGDTRFTLEASAAAGQSVGARQQFIQGIAQGGGFQPQNIPATIVSLQAMEVQGSDKVVTDLIASLQLSLWINQQMNPAPPPPPPPPDPVQQAHLETAVETAKIGAKAQADTQSKMTLLQATTQADILKEAAIRRMGPTMSLTAPMDPAARLVAEEMALGHVAVHEAAGHVAAAASKDETVGKAYGIEPPPPPPALPAKPAGQTRKKTAAK